jgi:hypothetical protein
MTGMDCTIVELGDGVDDWLTVDGLYDDVTE